MNKLTLFIFVFTSCVLGACSHEPLTKQQIEDKEAFILKCISASGRDKNTVESCGMLAGQLYNRGS